MSDKTTAPGLEVFVATEDGHINVGKTFKEIQTAITDIIKRLDRIEGRLTPTEQEAMAKAKAIQDEMYNRFR
jgi:hypothetical protein